MSAVVQPSYTEFPTIIKQARGIAYLYKWVGLYSIVFLTIVTIISMSNVFTAGELARYDWIKTTWAVVFSVAIDVNIVRLFVESKVDKSVPAFCIGIGLGVVTGAALLIEGLQQSIGLMWDTTGVQWTIGILVALRVLFVIILMAREGRKLGQLVLTVVSPIEKSVVQLESPIEIDQEHDTGPIINPNAIEEVYTDETPDAVLIDTDPEQKVVQPKETNIRVLPQRKRNTKTVSPEQKIRDILNKDMSTSVRALAKMASVSPSTAERWKKRIISEQQIQVVQ